MRSIDQLTLVVKHRTLLEPGTHFVHAYHTYVGTGIHCPSGHLVVKR